MDGLEPRGRTAHGLEPRGRTAHERAWTWASVAHARMEVSQDKLPALNDWAVSVQLRN
uniref:Uncharacterized protein n=1 Tax=Helianthus annuus TaxID=4232 RepID=A0A251TI54_HELAN